MSLTAISPPALDPVTLAQAKAHLRVTQPHEDALIAGYVLAAREYVETHTQRALITQTLEMTVDELGAEVKILRGPVTAVVSLKYLDTSGVQQTLAADQYRIILRKTGEHVIVPAYGVTWPSVLAVEAAVTVRFTAGYGDQPGSIPEAIRQAILLLVGHFYVNRTAVAPAGSPVEVPMAVDALLFPHRAFY